MQSCDKALLKSYMTGALKEGGEYFFTLHGGSRRWKGQKEFWLGTGRGWGESVMQEGVLLSVPNPNGAVRLQVNLLPSLSLASWRCSCSNSNPSPHSIPNTCTSLGAWESQAACHPSFLRKRRPKELKTQWLVVVSPTPGSYRPSVKMFLTARRRR